MKKLFITFRLLFCLILFNNLSYSQSISLVKAKDIAKNHLIAIGKNNLKSASTKKANFQFNSAKVAVENMDTLYYILNDTINKGFVIVSADQRAWPVIGYSTQGSFDEAKQPDAFKAWIEERGKEIAYIKANNLQPEEKTISEWNQLKSAEITSHSSGVEPLVKTTWDQGCYYNEQCPTDADGKCGHVWTGCTATAMSQIMKYWNYPTTGTGSYSYTHPTYGNLVANFGATTYQWPQMPNSVTGPNEAVAKLMFHCGVSVDMDYDMNGSGAYTLTAKESLINHFNYSRYIKQVYKGRYNKEAWISLLKNELNLHRPIIYSATSCSGHVFICDGYQNEDYFHFNWGWGGSGDGYYYIGDLNPLGARYNLMQEALINICPENSPQGFNGLSLTANVLTVGVSKTTSSVNILSSVNWTASTNQSWLTQSTNSGIQGTSSLELTATENTTSATRTAEVTVSTAEYGTQTITIIQPAKVNVLAGELHNSLTGELAKTSRLTLIGTIDARDFKTMRDEMPLLEDVDLSNVIINAYTGSEGTINKAIQTYQAHTLPTNAFKIPMDVDSIPSILQNIILPSSITTIGNYAFNACQSLKAIDIPTTVSNIGHLAFSSCASLTQITIPSSVTEIGVNIFENCRALQKIDVDKNNSNYSSSEGILFDKQQTSLMFCPLKKQGTYKIPATVNSINGVAFMNCDQLSSLFIPSSVNSIGEMAFCRCSASISVDANNQNYSSDEGVLYNKTKTKLFFCPPSTKGHFIIPSTVTSIERQAFVVCCDLSSVTIPNSVQSIGIGAFNGCDKISTINVPSSVTSIGHSAFGFCTGLTSVKISSSVVTINSSAFEYCSELSSITVYSPIPINLNGDQSKDVFLNVNKNTCTIYVPYSSKAAYQAADQWKDFKNIVEPLNGFSLSAATAQIGSEEGSTNTVELKANVKWNATCDQTWLTLSSNSGFSDITLAFSVQASNSITPRTATVTVSSEGYEPQTIVVTQSASKAVFSVTAGTLSSKLTPNELSLVSRFALTGTIDARDFKTMRDNMPLLEEIDLSKATIVNYSGTDGTDGVNQSRIYEANTIPFSAFMKDWQGKKNLKSIILPTSLTKVDWSAFRDCDGLITISIPSSVIEIGGYVFMDCDGITSIEIPASVSEIGSGVFWNCINLSSIKVYRSTPVNFVKMASTDVFTGVNKNTCVLSVPFGSKSAYQNADQWKDFKNIVEMPNQAPIANAGLDQVIDEGALVTLDGSVSSDPDNNTITYKWIAPEGIALSSTTSEKSTFIAPEVNADTKFSFNLVVNDGIMNSLVDQVEITVKQVIKVGVNLLESPEFKIFPNPTTGIIKIDIPEGKSQSVQVSIYDMQGKEILCDYYLSDNCVINFSPFDDGVYLLKIKTESKNYTAKIVLKK